MNQHLFKKVRLFSLLENLLVFEIIESISNANSYLFLHLLFVILPTLHEFLELIAL